MCSTYAASVNYAVAKHRRCLNGDASRWNALARDIKALVPLYPGVGSLLDRELEAIYLY